MPKLDKDKQEGNVFRCCPYVSSLFISYTNIVSTGAVRKKIAIFDRTYGAKGRVGGLKWEGGGNKLQGSAIRERGEWKNEL